MAVRGWGGSIAVAIGSAAGAGAAQLGLGYGLGIIAWLPTTDAGSEAGWVASLAWSAWIAATSTIVGAICADRLNGPAAESARGDGRQAGLTIGLWRVALAVAAAVGALVTVALVAVPARAATRADTFSPQTIAAGYAVLGVIGGLLIAIWALSSRPVARNVVATVGWLWLLAVVAVVDGVLSGRGLTSAQLGVWQITADSERYWFRNYFYWPGAALSLGSALVIGALAAWPSARLAHARVGTAVSGGIGPLMVAAAYFLAAPRLAGIQAEQVSAHLMAPYAVIAGLAGSVLVTALAQRAETRDRTTDSEPPAEPTDEAGPASEPTGETSTQPAFVPSQPIDSPEPAQTAQPARTAEPVRTPEPVKAAAAKPARPTRSTRSGASSRATSTRTGTATKESPDLAKPEPATPIKATAPVRPGEQADPSGPAATTRLPDADLDDDAYAPARAYVSETAGESAGSPATGSPAGGSDAPQPLWPAGTLPGSEPEPPADAESKPKSKLRRLGRRSS